MARRRGAAPLLIAGGAATLYLLSRSRTVEQTRTAPAWGNKYTNITLERAWFTASAAGAYRLHIEFWEEHNYGSGKSGAQGTCDTAKFKVRVKWRRTATGAEDHYDIPYSGKPNNTRNRYAEDVPLDVPARAGEGFAVSLYIHDFDCTNPWATGQDWINRDSNTLTVTTPAALPPGEEPPTLPPGREDPCAVYGAVTDPADPRKCVCPEGTIFDASRQRCVPPPPANGGTPREEVPGDGGGGDPCAAFPGTTYDAATNSCKCPTGTTWDGTACREGTEAPFDQQKLVLYGLIGLGVVGLAMAFGKPRGRGTD